MMNKREHRRMHGSRTILRIVLEGSIEHSVDRVIYGACLKENRVNPRRQGKFYILFTAYCEKYFYLSEPYNEAYLGLSYGFM